MVPISKTDLTINLEREIWKATAKQGVFGCFEVTIGWFGRERVDYITYDTKGVWRCYEIKVSVSDFRSNAHNTFVGHYNYYVMPKELHDQVKNEIPGHIGVYIGGGCHKRAKRQELGVDEQVLKDSLIRSLAREVGKQYESENPVIVNSLRRQIAQARAKATHYEHKYWELMRAEQEKHGTRRNKGA